MIGKTVNILISGSAGPNFHLYKEALEISGVNAADDFLPQYDDSCDGLLLAGGQDVSPENYGEHNNGAKGCDALRDRCEYLLIEKFANDKKPIFGICRGMQILNVYFGGTLIGDLPVIPEHHSDSKKIYHKIILSIIL